MYMRFFAAAAAASLMAGCAIHPEPEDVTGISTPSIVKQIRCETRDAARKLILRQLERLATYGNNPTAQSLLAQYTANQELMSDFNPDISFPAPGDVQLRNVFYLIYSAGVAYTFTLTMNEQNDLGTTFNFLGPWQAKFTLGITGNANRARDNERTFTVTDKFSYLLRELNTPDFATGLRYCDGHVAQGPNYIYPIAGQIGVYKTVLTFFQMAIFDGLAPKPGASGPAASTPAMADKLTFTTTLDLSVTPKLVFAQVPTGYQVTDGSGTGLARRKDTHQVLVGLALDPVPLNALRGFVFSSVISGPRVPVSRRNEGPVLVLDRITASPASDAERLAVQVNDQVKRKEFQLSPPPNQ